MLTKHASITLCLDECYGTGPLVTARCWRARLVFCPPDSPKNVTARDGLLRRDVTAWTAIIFNEIGHCYVVTACRPKGGPPPQTSLTTDTIGHH